MKKLDKIKKEFLEQFQNKLDEEHVDLPVELAFDILISADPSPNKKYVRWLIEIYINDGFLFEDINAGEYFKTGEDSKIYETLEVFMKHSQKLEPVNRSVNKYKTIADMWKMVKQYAEDKTGKEIKREKQDKAMAESEMVIDNDDMRVIVPLT